MKVLLIGAKVMFQGKQTKIKEVFCGTHVTLENGSYLNGNNIDEFLPNNLTIDLCYFSRKDVYSCESVIQYEKQIVGDNYNEVFETFYKMNNQLRYCNGSYYQFKDVNLQNQYKLWLNSDSYTKKSFELFYGNGVVD